ncbi:hypothetical protein FC83_GL001138 [Agrilactobacillus composti DSM 18527 = JCM 14202]|uniref:Cytoskeleton protein RodZ-like C-terminal domain-containing protein n=1 Tax=Agrilactobacillus composti DSM 18527 = JCM 14202 TaxID=1423734 RepID=X0PGM3_9LACO|nr:helix-turn-helix transcriptional regulator [Agrilactobacillus composti]KRM31134.1 hypothetical protein FC83_GL001138 [Agrilactobacillus composti DSM 18527 = JCM 14202]GAF41063.1 transcriptional regulator in cluster with unspecified monosaccharide ABC transport system [Agrilactobacillus composti DSM 18527 = JCM 14202]
MNELGQKLRQARIDKGYTIDDLQQITKIQKRYLLAIEEGNLDQLPGKFYVNAFIRQYAQTVGLDGQALLKEYQGTPAKGPGEAGQSNETETSQTQETSNDSREDNTKPASRITNEKRDLRLEKLKTYLPQIIIVGIVVILILGILFITVSHQRNNSSSNTAQSSASVKVVDDTKSNSAAKSKRQSSAASSKASSSKASSSKASSSKTSSSKSSSTKSSSRKSTKMTVSTVSGTQTTAGQTYEVKNYPAANNTVNISATSASTWVTVVANGTTQWQGSVTAAAPQSVQLPSGITSFVVTSGNAPVTELKINDTTVKLPTSSNVVQNYTFRVAQSTATENQ